MTVGDKIVDTATGSTTVSDIVDTVVTAWNLLSSTYYPGVCRNHGQPLGARTWC